MTTRLPTSRRRLVARLLQLALAAAFILPAGVARADETPRVARGTTRTSARTTYSADTFRELERLDDPTLDSKRGGYRHHGGHGGRHYHDGYGLSGGEVVLSVILLIIVFPIGLIVLIVLLADHG